MNKSSPFFHRQGYQTAQVDCSGGPRDCSGGLALDVLGFGSTPQNWTSLEKYDDCLHP